MGFEPDESRRVEGFVDEVFEEATVAVPAPFDPGSRWGYSAVEADEEDETQFTSDEESSTGGLDRASATTLLFPSIYCMSVVNSDTTDN